jgi:phosphatidate cytidylyltransferase
MTRIVTAAILLALLWATVRHAPLPVFGLVCAGAACGACWECYRLLERRGGKPYKGLGLLASAGLIWAMSGRTASHDVALPLFAALLAATGVAMRRRAEPAQMLAAVVDTLFPILFVTLGLGFLMRLRALSPELGPRLLLLLFTCVILADTAAFYVGRSLGRRRLAPGISPGKSREGAVAALVAGVAGAGLVQVWFLPRLPLAHALVLGALLAAAGILGDLAESVIKRAAGAKDSGGLLPGHGGLLDRLDSLLFAGPVLYYYCRLFVELPA